MDYQRIAQYYESRGEYDKAGDMWGSSGQDTKAVQLYLKVGTWYYEPAYLLWEFLILAPLDCAGRQ